MCYKLYNYMLCIVASIERLEHGRVTWAEHACLQAGPQGARPIFVLEHFEL
jgi:hypothetical protein